MSSCSVTVSVVDDLPPRLTPLDQRIKISSGASSIHVSSEVPGKTLFSGNLVASEKAGFVRLSPNKRRAASQDYRVEYSINPNSQ